MNRRTQWSLFLVVHFLAFAPAAAHATEMNDIDGDNDIDLSDFGILKANFGKSALNGDLDLRGDVDGNGKVDMTDFGLLKENFGKHAASAAFAYNCEVPDTSGVLSRAGVGIFTSPSSIPGDPSGDGKVDLTDFGILKANFGKTSDPAAGPQNPGDINGDNRVDLTDFGILKANFGKRSAASAAPEPSTWLLAALAAMGLAALRRKKLPA